VIAEIGVPTWYWLFLALGWAGLGALADFGPAWAITAATVLFGAVHSTIAPRVISGRRGSSRLTSAASWSAVRSRGSSSAS
jgi:hypothetical protein